MSDRAFIEYSHPFIRLNVTAWSRVEPACFVVYHNMTKVADASTTSYIYINHHEIKRVLVGTQGLLSVFSILMNDGTAYEYLGHPPNVALVHNQFLKMYEGTYDELSTHEHYTPSRPKREATQEHEYGRK